MFIHYLVQLVSINDLRRRRIRNRIKYEPAFVRSYFVLKLIIHFTTIITVTLAFCENFKMYSIYRKDWYAINLLLRINDNICCNSWYNSGLDY